MGPYSDLCARVLSEKMNVVSASPLSRKSILSGCQLFDENMCLPVKTTMGSIMDLSREGCDAAIMWDSCGDCRQKAYYILQQHAARRIGLPINIVPINSGSFVGEAMSLIPELLRSLWKHDYEVMSSQLPNGQPRIGLVGEIYTILEPGVNMHIIRRMERQGAQVHNSLPLSAYLLKNLLQQKRVMKWFLVLARLGMWKEIYTWWWKGLTRPDIDAELMDKATRLADRYFPKDSIGGHGKESIIWAIYYALAKYDAVVHILPFPCMPEATVSSILDEISKDYSIPVNHFVYDQHFGEQNIITRIEAMVSMLNFRSDIARREGKWLGVDVGSTTTKAALVDGETHALLDSWILDTGRNPIAALLRLTEMIPHDVTGICTTGSGRELAKAVLSAPFTVDEISAQAVAVLENGGAGSIIEIGGQDSNRGHDKETAMHQCLTMKSQEVKLELLEGPCPSNWNDYDELSRVLGVGVSVHEGWSSLDDLAGIIRAAKQGIRCVNIMPTDWGIHRTAQIAGALECAGIGWSMGTSHDSGIKVAASLHLGTAVRNNLYPADLLGPRLFVDDVVATPLHLEAGYGRVPEGPGLGVELNEKALARFSVAAG